MGKHDSYGHEFSVERFELKYFAQFFVRSMRLLQFACSTSARIRAGYHSLVSEFEKKSFPDSQSVLKNSSNYSIEVCIT